MTQVAIEEEPATHWERRIGLALALACAALVFSQLHPSLIFRDSTASGGDMGAHVWWPAYLRDHILTKWRISGWSPDYYAGFPAGQFYFPIPGLLVVLLDLVMPYNVAFKIVTVMGPVSLPLAAYYFARGLKMRWPAPPIFAAAVLPYLFFATDDFNQKIMGGTLPSMLAGEFSYSIALSFSLFFLGAFARAMRDRRGLALPAALLAAVVLSHIIVGMFAVAGALAIWLLYRPIHNFRIAASVGGVGFLLSAVWVVPLVTKLGYTTNTNYSKEHRYLHYLFLLNAERTGTWDNASFLGWMFLFIAVALGVGAAGLARAALGPARSALSPPRSLWVPGLMVVGALAYHVLIGVVAAATILGLWLAQESSRRWLAARIGAISAALSCVALVNVGSHTSADSSADVGNAVLQRLSLAGIVGIAVWWALNWLSALSLGSSSEGVVEPDVEPFSRGSGAPRHFASAMAALMGGTSLVLVAWFIKVVDRSSWPLREFLTHLNLASRDWFLIGFSKSESGVIGLANSGEDDWHAVGFFATHFAPLFYPRQAAVIFALAILGALIGLARRRRESLVPLALAVVFGLAFVLAPEGRVWNIRTMSFWYLSVMLLAACGATEIVRGLAAAYARLVAWSEEIQSDEHEAHEHDYEHDGVHDDEAPTRRRRIESSALVNSAAASALAVLIIAGTLPWTQANTSYIPSWAQWNYEGYEAKDKPDGAGGVTRSWTEYQDIMDKMGKLRPGRVVWEKAVEGGADTLNAYGTDFALMLLPYWTHGRLTSMEGVYFEASATVSYHFLMVSKLARNPSNHIGGLPYGGLADFDEGVRQMQLMGANYYMVQTSELKALAADSEQLKLILEIPDIDGKDPKGWMVYEVLDSPLVEGLRSEPVVLEGVSEDEWVKPSVAWFEDPSGLDRPFAADGPKSWARASPADAPSAPRRRLPKTEITEIRSDEESVSFRSSNAGVPVLVKVSAFPGWHVQGAKGPWRVTPNFMVVIPESDDGLVTLQYGFATSDWLGLLGSVLGLAGLVVLFFWRPGGPRRTPSERRPVRSVTIPPDMPPDTPADLPADMPPSLVAQPSALDAIFKAYDIRGVYPSEINEDLARRIGNAFAVFTGADRIVVARDMRPSSVPLVGAFIEGVTAAGVDVIDVGLASTDLCYFASGFLDAPGAMFTASHNPAQYNGIKLCGAGAAPVGEDTGLSEIKALATAPDSASGSRIGSVSQRDLLAEFAAHVHSFVDLSVLRPLRVVADTANGMGGLVVPAAFADLPFELTVLYGDLDGTFPNHPADPIQPENLRDLQRAVLEVGADIGLAFDGDADRVFLVDDLGQPVSGSLTTAIVAAGILATNAGEKIVHNLICSKVVPEVIGELGGTAIRTRVGHSFIKAVMAQTGAIFGGEHSGHYYFRENFRADSGLIAALVVLEQLSRSGKPLSELRRPFERYVASGEINSQVGDPAAVIESVAAAYPQAKVDRLDGLTVDLGDWWFNLRASNTEPLLRLNLEAADKVACDSRTAEVLALVRLV